MAWKKPTNEDLVATLSQVEVDEFKKSQEFEEHNDPTPRILADVAELVRGYCRKLANNGAIRIHPEDGYIPTGLMNPAMDIAAYRVLKRFNINMTDARQKAYDSALDILKDVADGKIFPESYEDNEAGAEEAAAGIVPLTAMEFNPHTLD